jgi:hypothetical protein
MDSLCPSISSSALTLPPIHAGAPILAASHFRSTVGHTHSFFRDVPASVHAGRLICFFESSSCPLKWTDR